MNKAEFIKSCIFDALSALTVKNLPDSIQVGNDWIYPKVAIQRLQSIQNADKLFPNERI